MGEGISGDQVVTFSIRLSDEALDRIENRVESENARNPGYKITKAEVIRSLLLKGLECIDN
jgi:hypothetical protein